MTEGGQELDVGCVKR